MNLKLRKRIEKKEKFLFVFDVIVIHVVLIITPCNYGSLVPPSPENDTQNVVESRSPFFGDKRKARKK